MSNPHTFYTVPPLKGKVGKPRAIMYAVGLTNHRYDLEHMIIAFGAEHIRELAAIIESKHEKIKSARQRNRVRVKANISKKAA